MARTVSIPLLILLLAVTGGQGQNYVSPTLVTVLSPGLEETSGLAMLGDELWTHNDSGDGAKLYQVDLSDGEIIRTVEVANADNEDWEDITHDDTYLYIGDIGNNDGSRTDLKVYRVLRSDLETSDEVEAEEINYHYSDQTTFDPSYHNTNFDCEALLHFQGNLYLFTKNWIDFKTNCYVLPDTPGDHEAVLLSTFDANCLVTGATMLPSTGGLALIGYTSSGGSFTWIFDGFTGDDFFGGQATKLIWTVLSQIEGVCDAGGDDIYISSEEFGGFLDPSLYSLDLAGFISGPEKIEDQPFNVRLRDNRIIVDAAHGHRLAESVYLCSLSGEIVRVVNPAGMEEVAISVEGLHGMYVIGLMENGRCRSVKVILP